MKVLKARAGVLTNHEVLTHLEALQKEFEIVSQCRKHNISRQIWRERGQPGQPDDVPTYEEDAQMELERLDRVKEREKVDLARQREEERRERVELRDREYQEALDKWQEESKKQTNGTKKRGGVKKPLPQPIRREDSPPPRPIVEPILTKEERLKKRQEEYAVVLQSIKDKEQYYAVRPMTDALKYITNGTMKYLTDPHYTVTRRQNPRLIQDLMVALQPYKLTKAEMLQIVNFPPRSQVELWLSMEELDSRLPEEEQHQELLDLIERHLAPEPVAIDPDQLEEQYPTTGTGYGDYEMDEEEMAAQGAGGQDDFVHGDKWGRETEEVEGRDIDE